MVLVLLYYIFYYYYSKKKTREMFAHAITSVTSGESLGVYMRNRKLRNILPSGAFWTEVTASL
jgi:hypothetical protein